MPPATQPRRRGPKPKDPSQVMSEEIYVRAIEADKQRFEAAAIRDGCTHADGSANLSVWIRGLMDKRDAETL